MSDANPVNILFEGMEKLGPGSDADTLKMLSMLRERSHKVIVDAGCGAGRHTLTLAKKLQALVHAVDSCESFLFSLNQSAKEAGIEHLVQTHCMDMANMPDEFEGIDLLWSEGAAYNIGFPNALRIWNSALKPSGCAVVSELSWLRDDVPPDVLDFFKTGYPDMRRVEENRRVAEDVGYTVLATHVLPNEAWIEGYYNVLKPRAQLLLGHPDEAVRDFAAETLEEIRIFGCSEDSYGYVFYVMEKA